MRSPCRIYLTGGASAVLLGWQDRSPFLKSSGPVTSFHFDVYSQTLAKVQRWHLEDSLDVESMVRGGFVGLQWLLELFESIEDALYRFPAVDPPTFRHRVEELVASGPPAQ